SLSLRSRPPGSRPTNAVLSGISKVIPDMELTARHVLIGKRPRPGQGGPQLLSMDLLLDAVVIGVLLGCFYAAVSLGLSVSFGLLDVPHVAHPAFLVLASYAVSVINEQYGIDPLVAGLLITPLFFVFGLAAYRLYYESF